MDFGQIITAMVTPFDDNNQINFPMVTELMNYLISNGTDAIIVAGTTGESPTLTHQEKIDLFKHAVKVADGKYPIIAGTGSNNTKESVELSKEAEAIGVDGLLLVTPYYNKPSQAGLYEHYTAIAKATKLPIMLYNIPGRTSVQLDINTIIALSKVENIVSLKDSSGNLDALSQIIEETKDNFTVYSGDDSLTLPIKSIGGAGVVSVSSHIIGNEFKEMLELYEAGEVKKAAKLHRKLLPIMRGLFMAPSPAPVKAALKIKGLNVGNVRLPLVDLTEAEQKLIYDLIESNK
ncbi:4-hydroxy-tetrahydrodipicolinate synthase [Amphibacillus xylanus]|uniref:4-hydroxy-tetrahydrodipicolinate synthase n=1 Tax=Amphibacillus xylanus (strain ATCC 51415 / DSM 6626 / JCM 7361 / LMG 17667 / NBRC 15112 / Ep01) TaxID=698758 RepID=K0J375_AMPXN|nr:4-hydroxy-tetrahydrodipicolinate synthase [Amphibacillus xylanus]BAM47577.1 dihydrodipicolinate synthase [Amphibacillus xylanus NBRC 15112]